MQGTHRAACSWICKTFSLDTLDPLVVIIVDPLVVIIVN